MRGYLFLDISFPQTSLSETGNVQGQTSELIFKVKGSNLFIILQTRLATRTILKIGEYFGEVASECI